MLSGIGPGAHLRDMGIDVAVDSPGVGQNLQDHPVSGVLFYTKDTTDLAELLALGNLVKWKATGKGPLSSNVGEAGASSPPATTSSCPTSSSTSRRPASTTTACTSPYGAG